MKRVSRIVFSLLLAALLSGPWSNAVFAGDAPELEYARTWRETQAELRGRFRDIHKDFLELGLADEYGLNPVLEDSITFEGLLTWLQEPGAGDLSNVPDANRETLHTRIARLRSTAYQRWTTLADFAARQDWLQREGALRALCADDPENRDKQDLFLKRNVAVDRFGWQSANDADKFAQGLLPAGKSGWLPATEADALHAEWKQAWTLQSEHFKLKGDIPYALLFETSLALEAEFDFFLRRFDGALALDVPGKLMEVYIFKNQEEYKAQFQAYTGKQAGDEGGRFDSATGRCYFFHYENTGRVRRDISFEHVFLHEVSHQLFDKLVLRHRIGEAVGKPHFWILEGLADYFGMLRVAGVHAYEPDLATLRASGRYPRVRALLDEGRLEPLQTFLGHNQAGYYSGESGGVDHYAQGAMLAAYLFLSRPKDTSRYVATVLREGKGDSVRFEDEFENAGDLDGEFQAWLAALAPAD